MAATTFAQDLDALLTRHGYHRPNHLYTAAFLKGLNLSVPTVIDIGVRYGTPALYNAFRDADFILVDPQKGGEDLIKHKPGRYRFKNVGLGSAPGKLTLQEEGGRSSFLERSKLTKGNVTETYEAEIMTFDALMDELKPQPPFGVKIDTEGFELEVVKGINRHLPNVSFFLSECSIKKRFIGSYRFGEFVAYLSEHGFELFTVLNIPDRGTKFYDCLFLPRDHPLFG